MGKVHGSLARAGKVKSQTPKVSIHASQPTNTLDRIYASISGAPDRRLRSMSNEF
ncbi:hypothetical protein IQ07DRAFT_587707 [Pyrenochaeta sp. DS3sAY3a]|nr:hypothetical protein IQ07DRAFT_587707 [Pyrenochaeta sp. DS3sAY3a]